MNELKDCTFKPSVKYDKDISSSRVSHTNKEDFFHNLSHKLIETKKYEELELKKQETELKDCTFKPQV